MDQFTLGSFPEFGLADARRQAAVIITNSKQGIDPISEKKKRLEEKLNAKTFDSLAKIFQREHFPKLAKSTQTVYMSLIKNHIQPALGEKEIQNFTRQDARRFLKPYAEAGQAIHGNRIHALLSILLNFAVDEGFIQTNPILGLSKLSTEESRDRVYETQEIRALWQAFESEKRIEEVFLKMLILLGQRRGETATMKWSEIDFKNALWIIPAAKTKNKLEHTVPLTSYVLNLIKSLKPISGEQLYVFNSLRKDNTPINSFSNLSANLRKKTGISDFRFHDIRRTATTELAKIKTPQQVLKKIINHSTGQKQDITAIYNRYDYLEEKRSALLNWEDELLRITSEDEQDAKITRLVR